MRHNSIRTWTSIRTRSRRRRVAIIATLAAGAVGSVGTIVTTSAQAASADGYSLTAALTLKRTETPVTPLVPTPGVVESYVQLYDPLPKGDAPHPAACDTIGYLRFRATDGPTSSSAADSVVTLMPGDEGGAAVYVGQARLVVQEAAAQGKHVEYWIINRRSACAVDMTGLQAAQQSGDYHAAFDYYWGGRAIDGKKFAGFPTSKQVPWLADLGLTQTLEDWRDVLVQGLPDPAVRAKKLVCGGHSLGGPITAALEAWDFDNNPKTTDDAGYKLCAGFFGLDTIVSTGPSAKNLPDVRQGIDLIGTWGVDTVDGMISKGTLDPIQEVAPILDPTVMANVQAIGIQAYHHPTDTSDYSRIIPASLKPAERFFLSKDLGSYLSQNPPSTGYRFTNQALVGAFMDDNSQPVSAFKIGMGTFDGPVVPKTFPLSDPGQMIPANQSQVYGWVNYDQMATAPVQLNAKGQPFTDAGHEVTDINTVTELMADQPVLVTEPYMPLRLVTDVGLMILGNRGADLSHLRYNNAVAQRPLLTELGGSGVVVGTGLPIPAGAVIIPGYHHLDLGLASAKQNNGRPEVASTSLTAFVLSTTGVTTPEATPTGAAASAPTG